MSWRFWQPPLSREVNEELAFHLEMRVRDLVAAGMTPDAARAEAQRRFGDLAGVAAECRTEGTRRNRRMGRIEWFRELRHDVGYALRTLRRNPGFTAVALATLALGLGGTTAIFSAVNAVVLRPLAVPEIDRVLLISESAPRGAQSVSVGNFEDLRKANADQPVFASLGSIAWANFTLGSDGVPERVLGARVNAGYFDVMQIRPLHGRVFALEEDRPGGGNVVVLSHTLWRRRFAADPAVVGRTVPLNGEPYAVIGVMPASFDFNAGSEELWVPAAFTAAQQAQHDEHFLTVYGRLRPGVTPEAATARFAEVMRVLAERYPVANAGATIRTEPMMDQFVGDARSQLLLVFGAVGLVLLIACANVANLLLARGAARTREFAIRAAIGAGRGRIVRQLLVESLVLALGAMVLGTGLAWGIIRAFVATAPPGVPRLEQTSLDLPTLGFGLGLAVLSTMVFGLAPAFRSAGTDLQHPLRAGQARGTGSRDLLRQALVVGEVALALILLVGATLLVRTALHLQRLDPGFEPRGVAVARLTLPAERYERPEAVRLAFETLLANLAARPPVQRAALVTQAPMGPGGGDNGLIPEGKPLDPSSAVLARFRLVSPGYFGTVGMRLLRGRDFGADDRDGVPRAMVVNQTLARLLFPGQDPMGKRVACCEGAPEDPKWKTIVGVVQDVRSRGPAAEQQPEFFLPIAQAPAEAWNWIGRTMTLVTRSDRELAEVLPVMRAALHEVDPAVPLYGVSTMDGLRSRALAPTRFRTTLLSSLAGVGFLLSLVGIYGVVSYLVTRRRGEIGVRMALGATPGHVMRLVVGQGLVPVLIGTALGAGGAFAASRLLTSWLGVSPPPIR